jgi:hypothetical protein
MAAIMPQSPRRSREAPLDPATGQVRVAGLAQGAAGVVEGARERGAGRALGAAVTYRARHLGCRLGLAAARIKQPAVFHRIHRLIDMRDTLQPQCPQCQPGAIPQRMRNPAVVGAKTATHHLAIKQHQPQLVHGNALDQEPLRHAHAITAAEVSDKVALYLAQIFAFNGPTVDVS